MKFNFFLSVMLFLLPVQSMDAQDIISVSLLDMSTQEDNAQINPLAQYDVELYRFLYSTVDENNQPDTASGLLSIPIAENQAFPLLCYQHGTVSGRDDVPSNLEGGYQLNLALASVGYITFTPDLQGLGTSKGAHSYVHSASTNTYSLDMLKASQDFLESSETLFTANEVFITGYSQGGHSAMAFHKFLEEHPEHNISVVASAPMSGPYSISDVMLEYSLGDEEYFTPSYIANVAISYNRHYQLFDELGDFFKEPYLGKITEYANEDIGLGELNSYLINTLNQNSGGVYTKDIIQDDILDSLFSSYPNPIRLALEDNDLVDWTPIAPTRMMYCGADEQVSFFNALITEETMNNNGAADVEAININPDADHGGCIAPATIQTLIFFAGFNNPTKTINYAANEIKLFPNPVQSTLVLEHDIIQSKEDFTVQVSDQKGRLYFTKKLKDNTIDVSDIPSGIYIIKIISDAQIIGSKFTKL